MIAPGFWGVYRGQNDPRVPLTTLYTYVGTFFTSAGQLYTATLGIMGPPQLTKRDYIELRWSPMIGLINMAITLGGNPFYNSNGAEGGLRDEGQYKSIGGGAINQ